MSQNVTLLSIHFEPTFFHIALGIIMLAFLGAVCKVLNGRRDAEVCIHDRVLEAKELRRAYEEDVIERQKQLG